MTLDELKEQRRILNAQIRELENNSQTIGSVRASYGFYGDTVSIHLNHIPECKSKERWLPVIHARSEQERIEKLSKLIQDLVLLREELKKDVD